MVSTSNIKSGKQLLKVFTDNKNLSKFIPQLPPSSLGTLIQEVGITDAGELIEFSTPDQFVAVVDESVWRSLQPGAPERFVPEEFLAWTELILEIGDEFAAERFAAMDEDLLTTAMGYYIEVQDMNLRVVDASDNRQEGQLDAISGMGKESSALFDQFEVTPVFQDEWAVIEPALIALRAYESALFEAILSRCCLAGSVLSSNRDSSHTELDAAHNREKRQESEGFVTPQRAGIFLESARDSDLQTLASHDAYDLDTQDYLNRAERRQQSPAEVSEVQNQQAVDLPEGSEFSVLNEAIESIEQRQLATKFIGYETQATRLKLETALAALDPEKSMVRIKELAYLSNLLVKGERCDGERIKADDSARLVMAVCNLGHELFPDLGFDAEPGLVRLFRIGWHSLQKLPEQTLMQLRSLLNPKGQSLDPARLWVLEEMASEINRPGLDADLAVRRFAGIHDSLDMLALVYDADTVKRLKLLINDVPRHQTADESIRFIATIQDLKLVSTFLAGLRLH